MFRLTLVPTRLATLAALSALAAVATQARADVLIDNLAEPFRATTEVLATLWAAQSFTTAATPVTLDAITLPLGLLTGTPGLQAELRADGGGGTTPGGLVATLGFPALGAGAPTPSALGIPAGIELAAGGTYWIVLGVSGSGGFGWSYANTNNWVGPGSLGNYAYSSDGGGSWANFGSDFPYYARIEVTPVPEPQAAWLLALGLAALGLRRRTAATASSR